MKTMLQIQYIITKHHILINQTLWQKLSIGSQTLTLIFPTYSLSMLLRGGNMVSN